MGAICPKAGEVRGGAAVEGMGWEPWFGGVFGTKGPWKSWRPPDIYMQKKGGKT